MTEEDIASSFEDLQFNDLFFFFGSFWLKLQDRLSALSPLSSSQALSHKYLPVKRVVNGQQSMAPKDLSVDL